MAIVKYKLMKSRKAKFGKNRSYSLQFSVVTNDSTQDQASVAIELATTLGIFLGSSYVNGASSDVGCWCNDIDADEFSSDGFQWVVTFSYSSDKDTQSYSNPFDEPVEAVWSTTSESKIYDFDAFNQPILNTAGCPMVPGIEGRWSNATLTLTANQLPDFNLNVAHLYADCVNADYWRGFAPGRAIVTNISPGSKVEYSEGGVAFRRNSYSFGIQREGWDVIFASRGLLEKGTDGKLHYVRKDGQIVTEPFLLDSAGKKLPDDGSGVPVIMRKKLYKSLPFNGVFPS